METEIKAKVAAISTILLVLAVGSIQAVAGQAYTSYEPMTLTATTTIPASSPPVYMSLTITCTGACPVYIEQVEVAFAVAYRVTAAGAIVNDFGIGCHGSLPANPAAPTQVVALYSYEYLPTCAAGQLVTDPLGNQALVAGPGSFPPTNVFFTGGTPPAQTAPGDNIWYVVLLAPPGTTVTMTVYA